MSNPKKAIPVMLLSGLLLFSFLVLMTAVKGDNLLRIILAGVGVVGFGGLLAALVFSKSRTKA